MTAPDPIAYLDPVRAAAAERALEQAEARINTLLAELDLVRDTLRLRSAAVNKVGADNDTLRATLNRVEALLSRSETARLVPYDYPMRVIRESDLRAILDELEPNA